MIKSMTAFARIEQQDEQGEWVWELRSVNHRYLDIQIRLPEEMHSLEPTIRQKVAQKLKRGKIECYLRHRLRTDEQALFLNQAVLRGLLQLMQELKQYYPQAVEADIMQLLRWPDVLQSPEIDWQPIQQHALLLLDQALAQLVDSREQEGKRLYQLIEERRQSLAQKVMEAQQRMPMVVQQLRQKLEQKLAEIQAEIDQERFEQEMIFWLQRMDVDEELDRLNSHLTAVATALQSSEAVGRRLDFLMQELNREANTLASKSNDAVISHIAVDMKVLIEQMREQVQNIE